MMLFLLGLRISFALGTEKGMHAPELLAYLFLLLLTYHDIALLASQCEELYVNSRGESGSPQKVPRTTSCFGPKGSSKSPPAPSSSMGMGLRHGLKAQTWLPPGQPRHQASTSTRDLAPRPHASSQHWQERVRLHSKSMNARTANTLAMYNWHMCTLPHIPTTSLLSHS